MHVTNEKESDVQIQILPCGQGGRLVETRRKREQDAANETNENIEKQTQVPKITDETCKEESGAQGDGRGAENYPTKSGRERKRN